MVYEINDVLNSSQYLSNSFILGLYLYTMYTILLEFNSNIMIHSNILILIEDKLLF